MAIATSTVPAKPTNSAAMAMIRMGVVSRSADAVRIWNLLATNASTIASTGTPVDSTHVRIWRRMTPAAR